MLVGRQADDEVLTPVEVVPAGAIHSLPAEGHIVDGDISREGEVCGGKRGKCCNGKDQNCKSEQR